MFAPHVLICLLIQVLTTGKRSQNIPTFNIITLNTDLVYQLKTIDVFERAVIEFT